jgi:hypothetical protein
MKQVAFGKHAHDFWNLQPNTKVLWTTSDEKWWHGLVLHILRKCAGATVVHQEDNAGLLKEGNYHTWLQTEFEFRDWKSEVQNKPTRYSGTLLTQMLNLIIVINIL